MKKLLVVAACLFMSSCIEDGHYTGNVVVIDKNTSARGNDYTEYTLYGCIGEKNIKWCPSEYEYNHTNVGDTIYLHDVHYYVVTPERQEVVMPAHHIWFIGGRMWII